MDDLMSEATGLVLASSRDLTTTELIKISDWESRSNSTDLTSLTLLRLSITNSIRDSRNTQSEVADTIPPKQTKNRQRKGSSLKKPKVDVQFLDSEENVSVSALSDENRDPSIDTRDQNKSEQDSESVPILQPLLKDTEDDGLGLWNLQTSGEDDKSNVNNNNNNSNNKTDTNDKQQQQVCRKEIVEIGLKLASRKFSDGIFENCSTYGLSCPEVLQEKDHCTPPDSTAEENQLPASDLANEVTVGSSLAEGSTTGVINDQKNVSSVMDDQIALSDSFFVNVVNGDPQNVFSKESNEERSSPGTKNSSRASLSIAKENNIQNLELATGKSERRLSRRSRRRHRKSKSKCTTSSTYECPKCGVSYILSSSASNITARCLHCDFWTSVEPVFMKREKQPWNTCRIC